MVFSSPAVLILLVSTYSLVVSSQDVLKKTIVPEAKLAPAPYYRWAHEHWIWNHNSMSDQDDVMDLMNKYKEHDIKFGGVNIDSGWETQFNNFEVNKDKFPDFQGMVGEIHKRGARVILWATSFVNTDNSDFQMAVDNKYLVRDKHGDVRPLKWWHGEGGLIDYSNPDATAWWARIPLNGTTHADIIDGVLVRILATHTHTPCCCCCCCC